MTKVEAPWTGSNTPSKISDPQQSVGGANGCAIAPLGLEPDSKPHFPDSILNISVLISVVSKSLQVLLNPCLPPIINSDKLSTKIPGTLPKILKPRGQSFMISSL